MNRFFNGFRQLPPGIQYTLILSALLIIVLLIAFPATIVPITGLIVAIAAVLTNKGGINKG